MQRVFADERVRFIIVGGINTGIGYALFVLVQWGIGSVISYFGSLILAHLISSAIAFALYRVFVFRVRGRLASEFFRFQSVYVIPLAANVAILPMLVHLLGWNVYLAQALIVVMSATLSYLGHKYFSFRRRRIEG